MKAILMTLVSFALLSTASAADFPMKLSTADGTKQLTVYDMRQNLKIGMSAISLTNAHSGDIEAAVGNYVNDENTKARVYITEDCTLEIDVKSQETKLMMDVKQTGQCLGYAGTGVTFDGSYLQR